MLKSKMSKFEICVCRYNEDLSWLEPLSKNCYIYNKGIHDISNNFTKCKDLPNVGREAHTILQYIIDNYDTLCDVTIFTQGNISDHKDVVYKRYQTELLFLMDIYKQALNYGFSQNLAVLESNESYLNYNFRLPEYNNKKLRLSDYSFGEWFEKELNIQFPNMFCVYWHSIFAIRKDYIQKRSKEFYINLLKYLDDSDSPEEAHYFERSWFYILV